MSSPFHTFVAALFATALAAVAASAQSYPTQTVRIVVAYAPGGTGDIVARLIAIPLAAALGQNVVVENRAGATGAIGTQTVVSAPPDGHTLLLGQTGEISINQHWIKGLTYNAENDLQPIALASVVPLALVVSSKASYSTMDEMAKVLSAKKPLTFASAGTGTPGHFAGEFLKLRTKANLTHVPYKGAGPALNDLLGGHVDMYFPGFPAAMPHVKSGNMKILAVSSSMRSSAAPNIPTVAEAINDKNFDLTLRDAGADVRTMSVAQFADFAKAESAKYLQIIKDSGVKPE
jgi:tripartite-type tricarboxylate transporter receptor subunit TctC